MVERLALGVLGESMMAAESSQQITAACKSDVGRVRDHNEDACLLDDEAGLFIVSDGMGGAQAGALASKIVVNVLPRILEERLTRLESPSVRAVGLALRNSILDLSQRLREESSDRIGLKGMGATVVLVLVRNGRAYIAHMGDSRAYLFRDHRYKQLTEDHSIVGILLRNGEITAQEARTHPVRGRLSRYIGMEGEAYPDVRTIRLRAGDRLLLCSDGLTGMVSDKEIARVLRGHPDPDSACQALVDAANAAGGEDNITVVTVAWKGLANRKTDNSSAGVTPLLE